MTLTTTLYRDILKKAKKFDKYPVLKVRISPPLLEKVFEKKAEERQSPIGVPTISNYFYTPHSFGGDTFYNTFRALFREGVYSNSATGVSNAFSIIRDLNNALAIAAKPKREEHKLPRAAAIPSSALTKSSSPSSNSPPSLSALSSLSSLSSLTSPSSRPNVEFILVGPGGQKLDKKQLTVDEKTLAELEKGLKDMIEVVEEEEEGEEGEGEEAEQGEARKGKEGVEESKEDDEKQRKDVQDVVKRMLLEFEQKALAIKLATTQTETDEDKKEQEQNQQQQVTEKNANQANLWVKASNQIKPGTILITQPSHDYDAGRYLSCFYRSVVLVCGTASHPVSLASALSPSPLSSLSSSSSSSSSSSLAYPSGTVGLILNKPLEPQEARDKYKHFALPQSKEYKKHGLATMPSALEKANWFMGGPVDAKPAHAMNLSQFGTFSSLYYSPSSPLIPDAKPLLDNIYCGGSIYKLMNAIENNEIDMEHVRLFLGCSVWSKGQLEEEINKGWWVQAEASSDFIFGKNPKAQETQWEDAYNLLGGEYPSFVQAAKSIGHPEPLSNLDDSRVPYCTLQMLNLR